MPNRSVAMAWLENATKCKALTSYYMSPKKEKKHNNTIIYLQQLPLISGRSHSLNVKVLALTTHP